VSKFIMEIDILGIDLAKQVFQFHWPSVADGLYIGQGFRVAHWLNACIEIGAGDSRKPAARLTTGPTRPGVPSQWEQKSADQHPVRHAVRQDEQARSQR
jgi:hypothetical protein